MLDIKKLLTKILQNIRRLPNYYSTDGDYSTRPTSANIDSDNSGGVIQFLSTGNMTEGKPTSDGNILHFNWDNSNKWASQLAIPHGEGGFIQWRAQKDGTTWKEWHDVWYDPVEIPANTDLNAYKYPSTRYCPGNATAATLSNCPTTSAFFLYIEKANRPDTANTDIYQYYTQTIKDIDGKVYIRSVSCNNGTWSYGSWGNGAVHIANNLTTANAGGYVLDAYQGKVLNDKFGDYVKTSAIGTAASKSVANNLTTASAGSSVLDAYQGKVLNDKFGSYLPKTGGTLSGNLAVSHSDTTESNLRVTNSKVNGTLYAASGGGLGIWNSTLGHAVISEDLNGTVSIHGWTNRAIANNLTTTSTGSVLDAYQGKVLADKLTVNSKTYTSTYTSGCYVSRVGKVAVLRVSGLKGFTSAADYTLFTLDAEYRPASAYTQDCVVAASNVAQCIRVTINTDGKVVAHNYNTRRASDVVNLRACIPFICAGT